VTAAQWERLKPLFDEAIELPVAERAEFLVKLRAEDAEIAARLGSLLEQGATTVTVNEPLVRLNDFLPAEKHFFRDGEMVIGRFRIVRFLGRGGMGEVYHAQDMQLGEVALKTLRPGVALGEDSMLRFRQEVQLARRVTSTNVCRIHDLFQVPGDRERLPCSFLTMELLAGVTMAEHIEREGPLPFAQAQSIALQLCAALQAIHDAGVIHRDFKSRNIMLVPREDGLHAVVMDLGLARDAKPSGAGDSGITMTGAVMGTPEYMAPEQFQGSAVTPAADVYALGIVLYELVTGIRPFQAATPLAAAVMRAKHPASASSVRAGIPRHWDEVINRCLEFEPEKRWASAKQVAEALNGREPNRRLLTGINFRRNPLPAIGTVVLVITALTVSAWLYRDFLSPKSMKQQRIAVLPFEDIGGSSESQAFRDGLMQTLSSQLTQLEQPQNSLSIVPASDIRKENVTSARDAQRAFGADLAITGSVQRSGDGLHLIVNVVDASRLKQIASREIFIPHSDAIAMQRGVVTQVASLLHIDIRPEAQNQLAKNSTSAPDAYTFYLQGSGYLLAGKGSADQAIIEFQHALDLDPRYALAHAGLGQADWLKYATTKDPIWLKRAMDECHSALQLDTHLAAAHVTLSLLDSGTGRYNDAIGEAKQAIGIDPGNDQAYSELSRALDAIGRTDQAEQTLRHAIQLRPENWNNYSRLGTFYFRHARYKDAELSYLRVISLVPDNPAGYTNAAAIYHLEGRETEAEQTLKKSIQVRPTPEAYSNLATIYFFEARYADAVPIMEKLVAGGSSDYALWGNLGDAYRWTPGQAAKAPATYQRAVDLANRALAVNRRDAQALSSLALYRAKLRQFSLAVETAAQALSAAPEDKNVIFKAAIVYEIAGKRLDALRYLGMAIRDGYSLNETAAEPELSGLRRDSRYNLLLSQHDRTIP